jgi:hypothetical protein
MGDAVMRTTGILDELRKRGIKIRRTPSGELQVFPSVPLSEVEKGEIRARKTEILVELDEEIRQAVARGEEAVLEILAAATRDIPRALVTSEIDGITFVTCRRRDGGGWTIHLPSEEWDPWRLATVLASASPEKIAK